MKSTKLEIEFCLDDSEDIKNYRIPILVLHTSKTKVGAMFIFFNKNDLMDISSLANNIQEMAVV
ncbi:MAG: hypothetical protein GXP60_06335 [Epsilonproteobacteria bacterium]|nr:hypothetical protein [Campylobacterota bacterium]